VTRRWGGKLYIVEEDVCSGPVKGEYETYVDCRSSASACRKKDRRVANFKREKECARACCLDSIGLIAQLGLTA
jgi:hypothetical protein